MLNTLFGRLFVASVLILSLGFGFIGYIINQIFVDNVHASKRQQLRIQNYVLLSSAQIDENAIALPDELREPLFDTYESGLYGFISDSNGKILWTSYSAHALTPNISLLQTSLNEPGQFEFTITPDYYIFRYVVRWELETDKPELLVFTVIEDKQPTLLAIEDFQHHLRRWLAAIGIGLIITLLLILRWGTRPLRQLAKDVKVIESGQAKHLQGNYPIELHGLASNLNQLIDSERAQRERYYTTMSDLAHSLKTPLAVIQGELSNKDNLMLTRLIADQVQRMDEIIRHQLQRAVMAKSHQLTDIIDVEECVERVIIALKKVYASKSILFEVNIADKSIFKGDQRDLMEIIGNVLDNACKACNKHILIDVKQRYDKLQIAIHDDGEGMLSELRTTLVQRGQRADTRHHGQGIGLDIVRDIVENYQGEFSIDKSPLGGAVFTFMFTQSTRK